MSAPSTWTRTRVDRVATVNARIGWKALTAGEYKPDGYAFLATPNIKRESIDFENVNYINKHRYEESPEIKLQLGDVLLAKDGNTLGITNIVRELPRPATVNGSIAVLRPFDIEPRFLRFALVSTPTQEMIQVLKGGMGVPHLFQWDIKRLPLAIPAHDEQRRIADFLDAETSRLDKLIQLRDIQVDKLSEGLRSAAAHYTGRTGKPHWNSPGWQRLTLRRTINKIQTGTTPTRLLSSNVNSDCVPWYTPSELGQTLDVNAADRAIQISDIGSVPRFPAGSILIVGIGESLGKVAYIDHEATGNQQLTAITTSAAMDRRFLAWQLFAASDEIRNWAQYSRIRILNNDTLKSFPILMPSFILQVEARKELDRRLAELNALRIAAVKFSLLAAERRQALITAAVTGQLDVTTAGGLAPAGGAA